MGPSVQPPKDWVSNPDGSLTRPLIGAEAFMAWMHDHREGGGRYTGGIDIQTKWDIAEAERRIKNAWTRTRFRHPLIGITFKVVGRGGTMSYQVFPDEEAALNWRRNTIFFLREADYGPLEEIMHSLDNHNTHPADGHGQLFVLARSNGKVSIMQNASHALLDFVATCQIWQTLLDEIALDRDDPIKWGEEVQNLPRAIANVLGEAYPQGWWAWAQSIFRTLKGIRNVRADSIRPPLHPDFVSRQLGTESFTHVFTADETTRFVKRCKELKTTVTYAYIAILALAMQELFGSRSGSGLGQAQVFAMPYNARRWLTPGLTPIAPATPSLGNTNAYIRIPHASGPLRPSSVSDSDAERAKLRDERVRRIVEFGDRYKEISLKAITGPTPDSVLASKTLSSLMVKAVEKSSPNAPSGALYGVVSQGLLDKVLPTGAKVEGSTFEVVNYRNGGRTVDANPLLILYTFRGSLTARHKWNSKYFDKKTFEDIDAKATEYFNDFIAVGASNGAADSKVNGNGAHA